MKSMNLTLVMILAGTLMLAGCAEEEQKARDRGKIPKQTVDRAQQQVDAAAAKMVERMKQTQNEE